MNTAFRDVIFINDFTLFRAWLLALLIAIIGANLLEQFGFMGDDGLRRQVFSPIAAIVGGYIFGLGIVVAGGCGSGVLYKQGEDYYFMDSKNYEQTFLGEKVLGDSKNYLKENIEASVLFYNGKAIGLSLPNSVDLKVVKCDPGIRGDTVSGATKPAQLETGYMVNVPLFINEGDVLKIDTRDGKYLTRVASA